MDIVIEKLSNLESIWRITSQEIIEIIEKSNLEDEEEFDIFKYKVNETQVIRNFIYLLIFVRG
jgi:hypothetical protein